MGPMDRFGGWKRAVKYGTVGGSGSDSDSDSDSDSASDSASVSVSAPCSAGATVAGESPALLEVCNAVRAVQTVEA